MSRVNDKSDKMCERAVETAEYVILTSCTVRQAAEKFNVSKSTVHRDLTRVLKSNNKFGLYDKVALVLMLNKAERHIRGGIATKLKWADLMECGKMSPENEEYFKNSPLPTLW